MQQRLLDALITSGGFEILRSSELKAEVDYKILRFLTMTTVHGPKIAIEVYDPEANCNKTYFLPPSYATKVEDCGVEPQDLPCIELFLEFQGFHGEGAKKSSILKFNYRGSAQLP